MEKWEYGYLTELVIYGERGMTMTYWITTTAAGHEVLADISTMLEARNRLGANGWIIDSGEPTQAGGQLTALVGRPDARATQVVAYMRRRLA
ncbi:hypothetical protein [Phytohabitans suffuscus]|uniref:Uncharacterized protein n=1 Tax=Phytohabitans suffuscus TaxID=624315 RepID=A0A6F8YCA3_9ACTN|nr:hypothetical protein [Phytohabitans suffuscus]BCB83726.1 hypothetical protein Psuf_010390 [Phytohabitans suffuscus]